MITYSDFDPFTHQKEGAVPSSNLSTRIGSIAGGVRNNSARGFGLPPTSKFHSGHLAPSAIPVTRTVPGGSIDSGLGMDNDMDTGSSSEEEGTYGATYSIESSPQDERVPKSSSYRYGRKKYASDYSYSDASSLREAIAGRQANVAVRNFGANGDERYSYSMGSNADKDYESDSASSSELSTVQAGRTKINRSAARARENAFTGIKAETAVQNVGFLYILPLKTIACIINNIRY